MANIPEDTQAFSEMLERVDNKLAMEGLDIPQRPIHALRVVSMEFKIPLPITPPIPGTEHDVYKYWPISQRIYRWYDYRYGDRLKMDSGPGRMAFLIANDVWIFRFPRLYGSANLVASRTTKSDKFRTDGKPATYNILDSIDGLPPGLRHSLKDPELGRLFDYFILGFKALSGLENFTGIELIKSAQADISSSIDHLIKRNTDYGLSKWASLQVAEKLLKVLIKKVGGNFSKTHDLNKLTIEAQSHGVTLDIDVLLKKIQCGPGIRYGQEKADLNGAIEAHHAVMVLSKIITDKL